MTPTNQSPNIGEEFNYKHAAGVTRYRINAHHRDYGYFECVAVAAISGTHHMLGGIDVFSRAKIEAAQANR